MSHNNSAMEDKECNLSVLVDFALMDTPIKECLTVFNLIGEEVDIAPTEDEFEHEKLAKTPLKATKRKASESCSFEPTFKSPYKKRHSSKLKSPRLLLSAIKRKSYEAEKLNARENKRRSLGSAKSRRSLSTNHRRHSSSISPSGVSAFSDNRDNSTAEKLKNISLTDVSAKRRSTIDSLNPDDAYSTSSKGESTSLATTDPLETETIYEGFPKCLRNVETLYPKTTDVDPSLMAIRNSQNDSVQSNDDNEKNSGESNDKNRSISIEFDEENRRISMEFDEENQRISMEFDEENQRNSVESKESRRSSVEFNDKKRRNSVESKESRRSSVESNGENRRNSVEFNDKKQRNSVESKESRRSSVEFNDKNQRNSVESNEENRRNSVEFNDKKRINSVEFNDKKRRNAVEFNDKNQRNSVEFNDKKRRNSVESKESRRSSVDSNEENRRNSVEFNDKKRRNSVESKESRRSSVEFNDKKRRNAMEFNDKNQRNSVESNDKYRRNSAEFNDKNRRKSVQFNDKNKRNPVEFNNETQKNFAETDDEGQNFSLILSPESKSSSSTLRREAITSSQSRPQKRKAICRVSPLRDLTRELEHLNVRKEATASPLQEKRRKISTDNPLEEFTPEIDHSIRSNDLEIPDLETEAVSFTFEPIKLFNELDDSNHRANNEILDKILLSPAKNPQKKNDAALDNVHSNDDLPPSKPEADSSTAESPETSNEKSTGRKTPTEEEEDRSDAVHLGKETSPPSDCSKNQDVSLSTSSKNENAKSRVYKRKLSLTTTNNREKTRTSIRLEGKESINMSLPDSENGESFSEEDGASIAENVAAAVKKLALSTETLNKLRKIVIRLGHQVPPQHEIENRAGSRPLSFEQQKRFIEYAPLNKARYTPAEDEIIMKNWNTFCKDHDWDPNDYKPFILLRHGGHFIMSSLEERRKFVQFLANGLPNRSLYSVYSRFRLIYDKFDAAGLRYTRKEDARILAYMKYHALGNSEACERSYSKLAKVMNRSRTSIWKRHTKLVKETSLTDEDKTVANVEWDLPLVGKFIATLLDVTLSFDLIDLKDAFLPRAVWLKMEEKMNVKFDVMQRFWDHKLHMQLFAPEPIRINEIRIKLIEYVHSEKITDSKQLKWDFIVKSFDGYTTSFLRYVFNHLKLNASLALNSRDFTEIVQWLHDKKIDELQHALKDKCLPRITYKDKEVKFVADDLARVRLTSEGVDDI